jgi:hypothetical protein
MYWTGVRASRLVMWLPTATDRRINTNSQASRRKVGKGNTGLLCQQFANLVLRGMGAIHHLSYFMSYVLPLPSAGIETTARLEMPQQYAILAHAERQVGSKILGRNSIRGGSPLK